MSSPLLPPDTELVKWVPADRQDRFYRLALWPDLFGGVILAREYGRRGQPGLLRLDPYPGESEASAAMQRLVRQKLRRGYTAL